MTLDWNPLADSSLRMDWLQVVPVVEVGRVSPSWNLDELHTDMKWDVGIGLRAMVSKLVIRIDTAFSEEEAALQMMVGHPF